MAGIGAMSMMPLKSSAQTQTPVTDKKQNGVEITVNPDLVRDEIRQLQRDSANVAVYTKFSNDYMGQWIKQKEKEAERLTALVKLTDYIMKAKTSDSKLLLLLEDVLTKEAEDKELRGNLEISAMQYIGTGVTVDSGESAEEINAKLAQQRALLNLLEQQQGK